MSLIKHSHKDIGIDRPGKDSYRLREAGCMEVLLLGDNRWALMHELRGAAEPSLDYLLDRMQACHGGRGRLRARARQTALTRAVREPAGDRGHHGRS